jgi:fimbrial chaperone protein
VRKTATTIRGILMCARRRRVERQRAGGRCAWRDPGYLPGGTKQVQLAVTNNDDNSTWLIQSWVENADGQRDGRFVITPPLFAMQGKKENTLRIIDATNNQLPQDRESLFWMNVKAIPQWINQSSATIPCSWRLSAASSSTTVRENWPCPGSGGGKADL